MENTHSLSDTKPDHGKQSERPWTTDEIRKNCGNWTLAGDVGLFHLLNEFSQNIISKTHETENAVDSLVHKTKIACAKINNVMNDFHMLSNLQFVENRVYDEEASDTKPVEKPSQEKSKEQREAEMLPRVIRAVELGLSVLDQAFDKIHVDEISDSEDEEPSSEGRMVLEPKDPYENCPLPFIIGSEEFQNDDYAGLRDLCEEEVVKLSVEDQSLSESVESSSSEEELEFEDDSEPLGDTKFTKNQNDKIIEKFSDKLSSSDESELFGSGKEENGYLSDSSLEEKPNKVLESEKVESEIAETKRTKHASVSSMQSRLKLPQVLPSPHKTEDTQKSATKNKIEDEDLFSNESENFDEDSPFQRKSGLFSKPTNFLDDDDDEQDMFGDSLFDKKPSAKKSIGSATPTTKTSDESNLFDDDDNDIFSTLTKAKFPEASKPTKIEKKPVVEKVENVSTPSSLRTSEKSFSLKDSASNSLFGDDSDADDLFSDMKPQKKKDATLDDDLFGFGTNSQQNSKISLEKPADSSTSSKKDEKKQLTLFEDSNSFSEVKQPPKEIKQPIPTKQKRSISLFDDSDSSEQESDDAFKTAVPTKPGKNKQSLFSESTPENKTDHKPTQSAPSDNDSSSFFDDSPVLPLAKDRKTSIPALVDSDSNDDDFSLFSSKSTEKVQSLKTTKPEKSDVLLFDDALTNVTKETVSKPKLIDSESASLFDEKPSKVKTATKKVQSLFEESDNFDLFSPKSVPSKKEPIIMQQKSPANAVETEKSEVSFDIPVDSTNTLNVVNKDRVRITHQRRKPTRKMRIASLQQDAANETNSEEEEQRPQPASSELFVERNLASVPENEKSEPERPKSTTHKQQEKQKMNLMSKLISEVSASKIGKSNAVPKDDLDDIDIFSTQKSEDSTKTDFSFLTPTAEESSSEILPVASSNEKSPALDIKADVPSTVSSDDVDNDDFFAEPSFQGFRSSISKKLSVLDLDDDDDDDDLFKSVKQNPLPKLKTAAESNDIFADDGDDIFAGIQKEKYEMFPSQLYDDEDDIFVNLEKPADKIAPKKGEGGTKESAKKQNDVFEDPLTGMLRDS